MKYTYVVIFFIAVILLIGAGCKAECKNNSDCKDRNDCTRDICVDGKCRNQEVADCHVGNGICEKDMGENGCNAAKDCGECSGNVSSHLGYKCDERNECVAEISKGPEEVSFSEDVSERGGPKISVSYKYENPFDIHNSLLRVEFELVPGSADISGVTIGKIQVMEKVYQKDTRTYETRVYGELPVERKLWPNMPFEVAVPLENMPLEKLKEEEKSLTIKVLYSYDKLSSGKTTTQATSYEKALSSKIIAVNTGQEIKCPASCDDHNPCTTDSCSEKTGYFCKYAVKPGSCCGNYQCDSGENECSCPVDCGPCDKEFGKYIDYGCSNEKCVPQLKDSDAIKPKTLLAKASFTGFQADIKTTFDEPFDLKKSLFKVEIEQKEIGSNIINIKCTTLRVTTGNVLLGETSITGDNSLGSVGATLTETIKPSFAMREPEEVKRATLTLSCEYDQDVKGVQTHYTKSYAQDLGEITFVNPE